LLHEFEHEGTESGGALFKQTVHQVNKLLFSFTIEEVLSNLDLFILAEFNFHTIDELVGLILVDVIINLVASLTLEIVHDCFALLVGDDTLEGLSLRTTFSENIL